MIYKLYYKICAWFCCALFCCGCQFLYDFRNLFIYFFMVFYWHRLHDDNTSLAFTHQFGRAAYLAWHRIVIIDTTLMFMFGTYLCHSCDTVSVTTDEAIGQLRLSATRDSLKGNKKISMKQIYKIIITQQNHKSGVIHGMTDVIRIILNAELLRQTDSYDFISVRVALTWGDMKIYWWFSARL